MKILTLLLVVLAVSFDASAQRSGKGPGKSTKKGAAARAKVDLTSFKTTAASILGRKINFEAPKLDDAGKDLYAQRFMEVETALKQNIPKGEKKQKIGELVGELNFVFRARDNMAALLKADPNHPAAGKTRELIELADNFITIIKSKVLEVDGPVSESQMALVQSAFKNHDFKDLDSIDALYGKIDNIVPVRDAKDCT